MQYEVIFKEHGQVKELAESEILAAHVEKCISDITMLGYRRINVILHSMGARVFLNYLSRSGMPTSTHLLGSVVFIHPEADSSALTALYPVLRHWCTSITIYCDKNDVALFWADWANYVEFLCKSGRDWFSRRATNGTNGLQKYSPCLGTGRVLDCFEHDCEEGRLNLDIINDDSAVRSELLEYIFDIFL